MKDLRLLESLLFRSCPTARHAMHQQYLGAPGPSKSDSKSLHVFASTWRKEISPGDLLAFLDFDISIGRSAAIVGPERPIGIDPRG